MKINLIHINISTSERICTECKENAQEPVLVRGHFRMVNGRKVYVRTPYHSYRTLGIILLKNFGVH